LTCLDLAQTVETGCCSGDHGVRAAQDALRQNPALHPQDDRRPRALDMPATIDDPAVLDEIGEALKGHGGGDVMLVAALVRENRGSNFILGVVEVYQ
jgi:hypothetical protein